MTTESYKWAVIGAGPAGIAAVGKLLDNGIAPERMVWIDPEFTVGDFGKKWHQVSSNTSVHLFLKFLHECQAFGYRDVGHDFAINALSPEKTCKLHFMAEPLQHITDSLVKQIPVKKAAAKMLRFSDHIWQIVLDGENISAHHVVLATGSQPKILDYADLEMVPLETALDQEKLQREFNKDDVVALFGSSHSAIIVLRHLLACPVKQVINFYRSPLCYAIYLENEILFDNTGLKGETAQWARENIDSRIPDGLIRVFSSPENIETYLPLCNKAVYAVGFERRNSLLVEGFSTLSHNPQNGIIAPGLYGLGIAFPEHKVDPMGGVEHNVGLWKFMDYLNRVMPLWLQDGCSNKFTSSLS